MRTAGLPRARVRPAHVRNFAFAESSQERTTLRTLSTLTALSFALAACGARPSEPANDANNATVTAEIDPPPSPPVWTSPRKTTSHVGVLVSSLPIADAPAPTADLGHLEVGPAGFYGSRQVSRSAALRAKGWLRIGGVLRGSEEPGFPLPCDHASDLRVSWLAMDDDEVISERGTFSTTRCALESLSASRVRPLLLSPAPLYGWIDDKTIFLLFPEATFVSSTHSVIQGAATLASVPVDAIGATVVARLGGRGSSVTSSSLFCCFGCPSEDRRPANEPSLQIELVVGDDGKPTLSVFSS